jgi:hypothetical protein
LTDDQDGDRLHLAGVAPWDGSLNPDSNDDGLLDGAAVQSGQGAIASDSASDGVSNTIERSESPRPVPG